MDDDFKRSNIPAFGDWDYADGLPITQYFESARQAGLIRYSFGGEQDLYAAAAETHFWEKPTIAVVPRRTKTKGTGKGYYPCVKEQKKQASVCYVTEQQGGGGGPLSLSSSPIPLPRVAPKPVDEDLYRISPELLYSPNPKKVGSPILLSQGLLSGPCFSSSYVYRERDR